jgi:hypothetical protein
MQQLAQGGVGERRFGLHPDRAEHAHAHSPLGGIGQQRRLADPGLAAHHQNATLAGAGGRQQPTDRGPLARSPVQHAGIVASYGCQDDRHD